MYNFILGIFDSHSNIGELDKTFSLKLTRKTENNKKKTKKKLLFFQAFIFIFLNEIFASQNLAKRSKTNLICLKLNFKG